MSWVPAPAAKALLTQATLWRPTRSTKSDGLKGNAEHAARESFHNPKPFDLDGDGRSESVVTAADLTHDPAHGMDVHGWIRWAVARRDPRIFQAISNGQIWTKERAAEGWRRYTGSNKHTKHCHVTVDQHHLNDVSPWFDGWLFNLTPPPWIHLFPQMIGDDMSAMFTTNHVEYGTRLVQLDGGKMVDIGLSADDKLNGVDNHQLTPSTLTKLRQAWGASEQNGQVR